MPRIGKFKNLEGMRFSRLTVVSLAGRDKHGKYTWNCACDCGNTKITDTGQLNSGMTKSCGCIHREQLKERNKTHGLSKTPIYNVWCSMKNRVDSENSKSFADYGKRGIKYCDKWSTFEGFYDDMNQTYENGLSIERIDVNGDYCKGNCKWIPKEQQALNTRRTRLITLNGITKPVSEFARIYGMVPQNVIKRLNCGWSVEEALTTPTKKVRK